MRPLKVLFLSAEVAPFAKAGGLADVCGSLPKALAALGHDVRIAMPAYAAVEAAARAGTHGVRTNPIALRVPMGFGAVPAGVLEATLPGGAVPVYFIAEKHLFGDRPFFYGYRDDPYRFAFFGRAALDLTVAALGWRPDVVHAHDWHAAPAVTWLATAGQADPRYTALPTVFTIHNLAHQGSSPWQVFDYLGIRTHRLFEEPYGEVNFMARGVYHATMISTVSPTYAREVLTYRGRLRTRRPAPPSPFRRSRHPQRPGLFRVGPRDRPSPRGPVRRRFAGATARQQAVPSGAGRPTAARRRAVGRHGHAPRLAEGTRHHRPRPPPPDERPRRRGPVRRPRRGAPGYEDMLRHLAAYHRGKLRVFLGYDAELAPLIYGGSDVFLMPSLFEPCGLGQLIAMRYGCARWCGPSADWPTPSGPASPAFRSSTTARTTSGTPCARRCSSTATIRKAGAPSRSRA